MTWNVVFMGLILFFSISLVSAAQVDKPLDINVQCSNSTYANLSYVKYTADSYYIINLTTSMTEISNDNYKYTIISNLNNRTGQIEYAYQCDVNGIPTNAGSILEVTYTGQQVSLSNVIIVIVFLFVSGLFLFLGNSFEKTKWLIKSCFYIASLIAVLLAINSGMIIASESLGLFKMSTSGLVLVISIILVMFLYLFVSWSVQTFKSVREAKKNRWTY